MYVLIKFSIISCRPLWLGVMSPFSSMIFSSDLKLCLPDFDFFAEAGVPTGVALAEQFFEFAVGEHCVRDFEAAGEGVHAADVGVEQIDRLEAFAADFGVEVDAALGEAAIFEDASTCTAW